MAKTSTTKAYLAKLPIDVHADLKLAAEAEGRSMNALIEDAVVSYVSQRTSGVALSTVSSNLYASYQQPDLSLSARSLRSAGAPHADIISRLGGSPGERD